MAQIGNCAAFNIFSFLTFLTSCNVFGDICIHVGPKIRFLQPLTDKEAETTGEAIFNRWICRYGTPLEIVSDNGKEFRNKLATELYKRLDIEHTTTVAYHPQCNAQAEVCNKTIAKYLNSFVDESTLDWEQYLAPMAFSYNTSLHRSIQTTPYFLTYGQDARTPSFPSPDIQRCYSETPAGDWYNTLQMARDLATRNHSKIQKPTLVSSNTPENASFKTIFCGSESTKKKEHPEQFYLFH